MSISDSVSSIQSGVNQLTLANTNSNSVLDEVLRTVQSGDVEGFNKLATEKFNDLFSLRKSGVFPYEEIVKQGDPRYLAILLRKHFISLQESLPNGKSLVHIAVQYRKREILDLLRQNGFEMDQRDREGNTPCHLAAEIDWAEAVKLFTTINRHVGSCNRQGYTPLHVAALKGSEDTILASALHSSAQMVLCASFSSPLHCAIEKDCSINVVRLLMRRSNLTPDQVITLAQKAGNEPVLRWLQNTNRITILDARILSSCTSDEDIRDFVDRALRSAISQDQVNQAFIGILSIDSQVKAYNIMKSLLCYLNPDVDFKFEMNSALHLATMKNWPRVVQLLLEFGASTTAINGQGYTAPQIAKYNNMQEVGAVLGVQSHEYRDGRGSASTFHGAIFEALFRAFFG